MRFQARGQRPCFRHPGAFCPVLPRPVRGNHRDRLFPPTPRCGSLQTARRNGVRLCWRATGQGIAGPRVRLGRHQPLAGLPVRGLFLDAKDAPSFMPPKTHRWSGPAPTIGILELRGATRPNGSVSNTSISDFEFVSDFGFRDSDWVAAPHAIVGWRRSLARVSVRIMSG